MLKHDNETGTNLEGAWGAHCAAVPHELAIVAEVKGLALVGHGHGGVGVEC
jgi:hypothetical protein